MKILLYILLLSLFCSCSKDDYITEKDSATTSAPDVILSDSSTVALRIFTADAAVVQTRADAESVIKDLNIYLFNTRLNFVEHHYLTSGSTLLNMRLVNGEYDFFVIANYGYDLGAKTTSALYNLRFMVNTNTPIGGGDRMVMSAQQSVGIDRNTTLNLPLERLAAKATFKITMSSAMAANSKIVHIQLYNCNNPVYYFKESRATGGGSYPVYDVSQLNLTRLTQSYYLSENRQGKNNAITTQKGRTRQNAPQYATYLWIRIERNMKFIDYRVYLGENTTNDFNVCRNTNYNYNVLIEGENPADLRISTTSIIIYSNKKSSNITGVKQYNKLIWVSKIAYAELQIITQNCEPDNTFTISFYKLGGTFNPGWAMEYEIEYVTSGYEPIREFQNIQVFTGNGVGNMMFAFTNGSGSTQTTNNQFYVTVRDKYGYCKYFTLTTSNL